MRHSIAAQRFAASWANRGLIAGFTLLLSAATAAAADRPELDLKPGDKIAIIGNTLADRMQHAGYLETLLYSRFPRHELVVRNLGFSGDELTLRLRSAGFGTPDEHLARVEADVVFAFFGYNESFAGVEGLAKFRGQLDAFVNHTLNQKYNGTAPPRLVLFSPIAHENLHDANLPDGAANNARLEAVHGHDGRDRGQERRAVRRPVHAHGGPVRQGRASR